MNDFQTSSGQPHLSRDSNTVRVQLPDVALADSPRQTNLAATMSRTFSNRMEPLSNVSVGDTCTLESTPDCCGLDSNADTDSHPIPDSLEQESLENGTKSVDRVIDSILQVFPLNQPATIVFVGSKNDVETDNVALGVASRLAKRRVGKVLLVDSNAKTQALSDELGFTDSEGIGNVVCQRKQWRNLLQLGPTEGLEFLPYGTVNTAKMVRSRTAGFLETAKEDYQFVCVSIGLNEGTISKSFCSAANGIYLVIDLHQTNHVEVKFAADQFQLNKQPLIGCIALDAEQESL